MKSKLFEATEINLEEVIKVAHIVFKEPNHPDNIRRQEAIDTEYAVTMNSYRKWVLQ